MTLLGKCRHKYAPNDYCGLTVVATRYGPGHVAPPRVSHYPALSYSTAAAASIPTATVDGGPIAGQIGIPGVGTPVRVRRSQPVKAGG